MNGVLIFILRLILAMAFSVILTRLFHPEKSLLFIVGTGAILISMAYILEFFKHRGSEKQGDTGS